MGEAEPMIARLLSAGPRLLRALRTYRTLHATWRAAWTMAERI